jgi:hypothetical protein
MIYSTTHRPTKTLIILYILITHFLYIL